MRRAAILVVLPLFAIGCHARVVAQSVPATPQASECTVPALEDDVLLQLSIAEYVPAGEHVTADSEPEPDDVTAAIETVLMSVACTNANRQNAALALFTDRYLTERFSLGNGPDELGHLIAASTRDVKPAAPEDQLAIEAIGDAVLYEDGRIALPVQTSNANEVFQDMLVFEKVDEVWLIDEVLPGDETVLKATPEGE